MALPYSKPAFFTYNCEIVSPKGLPMLSTLDVYDTPVSLVLSLSHGKVMASMRWPHEGNGSKSNVLSQTKLDSTGKLTASVTAFCPEFGQGLLEVFAKSDDNAEYECLCVFLVRNSGNSQGRQNVTIYSGFDLCLNYPTYGDFRYSIYAAYLKGWRCRKL
jgi:hypothetical protein